MATVAYNQFVLNVPAGRDTSFLKDLTKRMGWSLKKVPTTRPSRQLQKAIDEVHDGKLIDAIDAADVIRICLD